MRLLTTGISQILRSSMTASGILGIEDEGAKKLVLELGFASLAIGLAGVLTMVWPDWIPPVGTVGSVFLGLAGLQRLRNTQYPAQREGERRNGDGSLRGGDDHYPSCRHARRANLTAAEARRGATGSRATASRPKWPRLDRTGAAA